MFKMQAEAKKKLDEEFRAAKDEMNEAAKRDATLRKQVRDLTMEVERKKRLAMQAIAARGQFKTALEDQ